MSNTDPAPSASHSRHLPAPRWAQHFDQLGKELMAKYEKTAPTEDSNAKGGNREAYVRDFVQKHFENLGVGKGTIITSSGHESTEMDLVLYRKDIPQLHLGGSSNVYFAESVVGVIEVKSTLDQTQYNRALDTLTPVAKLESHGFDAPPSEDLFPSTWNVPTLIFAYKAGFADWDTLGSWSEKYRTDHNMSKEEWERFRPRCICILNKEAWISETAGLASLGRDAAGNIWRQPYFRQPLWAFFLTILSQCAEASKTVPNWMNYLPDLQSCYPAEKSAGAS